MQNSKAFQGNTYLLVDVANSSATFLLTAGLKQNKIATIIGSETGGNLKGTNGGQLFFLWQLNNRLLKGIKWEKGMYKEASIQYLKRKYTENPRLFLHWQSVCP